MSPVEDSAFVAAVRRYAMRNGISIPGTAFDRVWIQALIAARWSPEKRVWRARIDFLTADGLGTVGIMAATSESKICVWRWQRRFKAKGVKGLIHDRTRPPGIAPLASSLGDRAMALTLQQSNQEAKH